MGLRKIIKSIFLGLFSCLLTVYETLRATGHGFVVWYKRLVEGTVVVGATKTKHQI